MPTEHSAPPQVQAATSYEFGPFRLDPVTRSLFRAGEFVSLTPKAAETLLLLLEEAGRVVTKEQLLERVWPGVVVEEGGIANNISALRKILDPGFGGEGPIATVARRGYRFTAPVGRGSGMAASPAVQAPIPAPADPERPPPIVTRDSILVADIENKTGDPVFDGTLRQALTLHLAQSPFLEILVDRKVHSVLAVMGRSEAPILGEVALELCQRTGVKAAITGSIFALGEDYVIGLQAVDGAGDILVAEQSRAHGKGEVLAALDRAAMGLRAKLGESLASVKQFSRAFDDIATSSLEALQAYSIGRHEWFTHGEAAAKPHQLRAIELDPNFASGYSALAIACNNMGQTLEAVAYMQKAFDLRARASEYERMRLEAGYHTMVTGDIFKSIDAHRVWERIRPTDTTASINLGNLYSVVGQWDKARACAERAMAVEQTVIDSSNLAIAQLALGQHEKARATLANAFARRTDAFFLHLDSYQEAFLRGDTEEMQRQVDAVSGRAGEEDFLIACQADTEAFHGRFSRARDYTRRAVDSAQRAGSTEMAAIWEVEAALREAEVGNFERALAGAAAALEMSSGRHMRSMAALVFARAGNPERALQIAGLLKDEFPQDTIIQRYWLACIGAALALAKQDWKTALDALEPARALEFGLTYPFEGGLMYPPYLRALALAGAGRSEEATREFLKIVERPGLIKNFLLFPLALRGAGQMDRFGEIWSTADKEVGRLATRA